MDYSIETDKGLTFCTKFSNLAMAMQAYSRNKVYADINGDMIKVFDEIITDINPEYIFCRIATAKMEIVNDIEKIEAAKKENYIL